MAGGGEPRTQLSTRRPLSLDLIVDAALAVLDDDGIDDLTTTNVARRLGVSQPALYGHIANLDQLQREVAARGARELSGLVQAAVAGVDPAAHDQALLAMAHAYRDYVTAHPARYLLQLSAPRNQAHVEATEQAAESVRGVLRRFGLTETQVVETHVAFRAAVHGFVHLEARKALAADASRADEHFDFFVGLLAAGLRAIAPAVRHD